MKNRKHSLILKICIIALMIILSTIGIVWAVNNNSTHITGIEENDSYYDVYKAEVSFSEKPNSNISNGFSSDEKYLSVLEGLYSKLVKYSNVLCCQHHAALNDAEGYFADVVNVLKGSPAQSYILAHMPGDGMGEYTDVQNAWWTLIDRLGIKGKFEEAIQNGSFNKMIPTNDIPATFDDSGWNMLNVQQFGKTDITSNLIQINNNGQITQTNFESILLQYKDKLGLEINNDGDYNKIFEYIIFAFQSPKNGVLNRFEGLDAVKQNNQGDPAIEYTYVLKDTLDYVISDFENYLNKNDATRDSFSEYLESKYSGYKYRMQGIDAVEKLINNSSDKKTTYKNILKILKEVNSLYVLEDGFRIAGSMYNGQSNDLYTQAAAYEAFYNQLMKEENRDISMYTDKMQVNFNSEMNAYVVGPIKLDYYTTNYNYAKVSDFYLEVDGVRLEKQYGYTDGTEIGDNENKHRVISQALPYGTYALVDKNMYICGNENGYNFPARDQEFYIVFTGGKGQNQITQLGFTYEYLAHESSYMFYKLYYGAEKLDMQDLAEAYSAHLWWQPTELKVEFDIPRQLTIEKKVKNGNASDRTFYFKVYDQAVKDESKEELELPDGTKTGARLCDIVPVKGNDKSVFEGLASYKRSEWPEGAPKTYVVEVDAKGHRFVEYGDWDCDEEDSIWRDYRPENMTGIYEQNYSIESSYVSQEVINDEIEKHFHLSVDKRISENKDNDTFYARLELTLNGNTGTYILPLTPSENSGSYDLRCPDGPNDNGFYVCTVVENGTGNFGTVETGKFDDGYLHAKWSATYDGYSSDEISYKVREVDENFLDYGAGKAQKYGGFWYYYSSPDYERISGKIEACDCNGTDNKKSSDAVITNKRSDFVDINIELSKNLQNEYGDKIESDDEYKFNVTILKNTTDTSDKDNILEQQTLSVKANDTDKKEFKSKLYSLDGNKYYLVIEEQECDAKWTEVIQNFGPENWNLEKENDEITKIWTELDTSSKKLESWFTNVNTINKNKFTIKKQVGDLEETKKYFEENPEKEFVFEIHTNRHSSISLDNFAESDVKAGYVKLNEKTGRINVIINKDNYENGVTTNDISWKSKENAPVYDIYEIDEHGNTYLQWIELGQNRPEKSVFDEFTPQDGGHYQINLMDSTETINVEFINNSYEVLLKKIVMTNGEDKTAEFFEKVPDAHFNFKFYDNNNNDVTSKYFETKNGVIVINKDNYENGVLSNKISTTLEKEYKFVEIFDGNEENLYETDKIFPVTLGENNTVVVEAVNKPQPLRIDKVVEGLDGDDFLPEEEFYFRVFEDDEDVTERLFGKTVVTIDYDTHKNGGVTSNVIYGDHTYTIVEFDKNDVVFSKFKDYEVYNGENSEFWDDFTPSSDGKWKITLSTDKGPSFVQAVNYVKTNITIEKELVGEDIKDSDKNIEFDATLVIKPSANTDWVNVNNNTYPTKTSTEYYDNSIKVSANKSYNLDGIYWQGEAPTAQVLENASSMPDGWKLVGYRINDEFYPNSVAIKLKGGENITFVIQNEKDTDEFKIPVTKTIVDQNGIPTTVDKDMTFFFDIYVENKAGEYKGNSISSYEQGKYSAGKYVKIDRLEVFIPAGSSQGVAETEIINVNGGSTLDYKVVEVDQNGNSFADYNNEENSYWDTFEPTIFSNGKWGSKTGIWEGTLSDKNPTSSVAKVDAYNKVNNVIIDLNKYVIKDGKLQEIEEGETFKFKAEFTSEHRKENEDIIITYDKQTWNKQFTLKRGETIHYIITEVDPVNDAKYDAENPTDFWKEFTPSNGTGIIEGDVDGSSAIIELTGVNIKNYHGWLTIKKEVGEDNNWKKGEKFYFIVEDKAGNNVTDKLYPDRLKLTEKGDVEQPCKLELTWEDGKQIATSKEIFWRNKGDAPTYKVTEVDYNKELYTPEKESIDVTIIENDIDVEFDEAKITEISGYATFKNDRIDKRYHGWMVITKDITGGEWQEGETFGFKVFQGDKDVTKDLYGENELYNSEKDMVVLEYEPTKREATSRIVDWKKNETTPTYEVREVEYDTTKYTPTTDKKVVTLNAVDEDVPLTDADKASTAIYAGFVNEVTTKKANLLLSKQVDGPWDDGVEYEFKLSIIDSGKTEQEAREVTVKLNNKNQSWTEELVWNKSQTAPKVMLKETDFPDVEISVNGTSIKPGEWYQLGNNDNWSYTFACVNHIDEKEANLTIIKKAPKGSDKYEFGYQYSFDNGNTWVDYDNIKVEANSTGELTEKAHWDSSKPMPLFRIWEISDDGLISIEATNAGTITEIEVDGHKGIQGTLNSDEQVVVTATNGTTHNGSIRVVKEFEALEGKQDNMKALLEQVKAYYGGNYTFDFKLRIYYENSEDKFTYNGEEKNEMIITKSLTIQDAINSYSKEGIEVIGSVEVSWIGKSAPKYVVTESNSGSFYEGIISDNSVAELVENETITVRVINTYDYFERIHVDLNTSLAGDVWIDNEEDGKTVTSDNKLGDNDKPASNVYVVPYKCIVDENNNIIDRESYGVNSSNNQFIIDTTDFYYYISESDSGHWEFKNVKIPAFNLDDSKELDWYNKGYKIKYYVEFYYDGVKYESVKPLVDGSADDYMALNSGYEKYFDNSTADENEENRKAYNSKYATVEGRDLMNSDGKSTGIIKDKDGNVTTTVDYSTETLGSLDGSDIIRATTTGIVDTKKLDEINNIDDLRNNFMLASTEETNLLYCFSNNSYELDGKIYFIDAISLGKKSSSISSVLREPKKTIEKDPTDDKDKVLFEYFNDTVYIPVDYAQHINLGLIKREQADVQIDKKIESATLIINDKVFTYTYKNSNSNEIKENEKFNDVMNQFTRTVSTDDELYAMIMKDVEKNQKELNIYTSDYYYRTSMYNGTEVKDAFDAFYNAIYGTENEPDAIKTKELQIYLTYSITVQNQSGQYGVVVKSIDDYYDSNLTFVDVGAGYGANVNGINNYEKGPGLWAYIEQDEKEHTGLTNVFGGNKDKYYKNTFTGNEVTNMYAVNDKFNKMTIKKPIDLPAGASSDKYYVTYRVNRAPENLEAGIIIGIKNNIAEITSFTPYLEKDNNGNITKYAAVIDKDSAPGNYNIEDETTKQYMEDDTDIANLAIKIDDEMTPRSISGTAWLDKEDDNNMRDGQKLGDSKLNNDDYRISGINTKLVEVIDLPIRKDENGNFVYSENDYTEYEFYWNGTETTTGEDGFYEFKNYVDSSDQDNASGVIRDSLVPGNYVVRFFYGDKDTGLSAVSENADTTKKIIRINGEDYKTTAYQKDKQDLSNDNYIQNEWHDINSKDNDNNARDNEARRLQIIKETQTLSNNNTAVFEVANYADAKAYADAKIKEAGIFAKSEQEYIIAYNEYVKQLYGTSNEDGIKTSDIKNGSTAYSNLITSDGYYMFADTAKMNLKVENQEEKDEEDVKPAGIKVENVNLGLEERSRTKMYLDKQAEEITLTTSSGKTFFHVVYDIDYVVEEVENIEKFDGKIQNRNKKDGYEYNLIDFDKDDKLAVWVGLKLKGEVIGANNLQALDDNMNVDKIITQGFRYINIDSTVLQGLKLDIRYRFTAINLSETDKYGDGINSIMTQNDGTISDRNDLFTIAIKQLSSPEYKLGEIDTTNETGKLYFSSIYEDDMNTPKRYGEFLGHTYYQGFNDDKDYKVRTTTHQIVDYIDNDIEFDALANTAWGTEENTEEQLRNRVDAFVFVNGKIQDPTEVDYKAIVTSIDSETTNGEFVKPLEPKYEEGKIILDNDPDNNVIATTTISTSKLFASTDKGNTGMDNFAEILVIENTVGRRDMSTVYGNYDPRGGATSTTDRDETSTEIVTLSPPTGNEENDRTMLIVISIICGVAVISGTAVGFKKKFSGQSKSKTE